MSPRTETALRRRNPLLFGVTPTDSSKTSATLGCRDGRAHLLDSLAGVLQALTYSGEGPQLTITSVKEHDKRMTVGVTPKPSPRQQGAIDMAWTLSRHLCEKCGHRGSGHETPAGWFTLCPHHAHDLLGIKTHLWSGSNHGPTTVDAEANALEKDYPEFLPPVALDCMTANGGLAQKRLRLHALRQVVQAFKECSEIMKLEPVLLECMDYQPQDTCAQVRPASWMEGDPHPYQLGLLDLARAHLQHLNRLELQAMASDQSPFSLETKMTNSLKFNSESLLKSAAAYASDGSLESEAQRVAGDFYRSHLTITVHDLAEGTDPVEVDATEYPARGDEQTNTPESAVVEIPAELAPRFLELLADLQAQWADRKRMTELARSMPTRQWAPVLMVTPQRTITLHLEAADKRERQPFSGRGSTSNEKTACILMVMHRLLSGQALQAATNEATQRVRRLRASSKLKVAAKPIPYTDSAPPLKFPHTVLDRNAVSMADLGNAMVTGASGVGKTIAVMFNAITAAVKYQCDELHSSILVIDPKSELKDVTLAAARELGRTSDVLVIGENAPKLYAFYEGDGKNFYERMKECRSLGCKSLTEIGGGENATWLEKANQWAADVIELDEAVAISSGGDGMLTRLLRTRGVDIPDTRWGRMEAFILHCTMSVEQVMASFLGMEAMRRLYKIDGVNNPMMTYAEIEGSMSVEQLMYLTRNIRPWTARLAAAEQLGLVNFDPFPHDCEARLDLEKACDNGRIIVYQPGNGEGHDSIARLLKSQFFEAVTHRTELKRPMFYIVDEFQRFITFDERTGEHAFLDRCRAYRCNAVLATQSLAAISTEASAHCVDAILANCRTQIYLRNVDPMTQRRLLAVLPSPRVPGLPHISEARPLSDLRVGQAYYRINNEWGLSQYRLPAAPEQAIAA